VDTQEGKGDSSDIRMELQFVLDSHYGVIEDIQWGFVKT